MASVSLDNLANMGLEHEQQTEPPPQENGGFLPLSMAQHAELASEEQKARMITVGLLKLG